MDVTGTQALWVLTVSSQHNSSFALQEQNTPGYKMQGGIDIWYIDRCYRCKVVVSVHAVLTTGMC